MNSTRVASSSPMYSIIFLLIQGLTRFSINTYVTGQDNILFLDTMFY